VLLCYEGDSQNWTWSRKRGTTTMGSARGQGCGHQDRPDPVLRAAAGNGEGVTRDDPTAEVWTSAVPYERTLPPGEY